MNNARYTAEELNAYVDGEAEARLAERIRQDRKTDPVLASRLEQIERVRFLASSGFQHGTEEPVPPAMLQATERLAAALAQREMRAPPGTWRNPRFFAMAASMVMALAVTTWVLLDRHGEADIENWQVQSLAAGALDEQSALAQVLSSRPSGEPWRVGKSSTFFSYGSFRAADGRWCREFEVSDSRSISGGIACREASAWRIEAQARLTDGVASSQYVPVAGEFDAKLGSELRRLGAGELLDIEAEALLLGAR